MHQRKLFLSCLSEADNHARLCYKYFFNNAVYNDINSFMEYNNALIHITAIEHFSKPSTKFTCIKNNKLINARPIFTELCKQLCELYHEQLQCVFWDTREDVFSEVQLLDVHPTNYNILYPEVAVIKSLNSLPVQWADQVEFYNFKFANIEEKQLDINDIAYAIPTLIRNQSQLRTTSLRYFIEGYALYYLAKQYKHATNTININDNNNNSNNNTNTEICVNNITTNSAYITNSSNHVTNNTNTNSNNSSIVSNIYDNDDDVNEIISTVTIAYNTVKRKRKITAATTNHVKASQRKAAKNISTRDINHTLSLLYERLSNCDTNSINKRTFQLSAKVFQSLQTLGLLKNVNNATKKKQNL